MTTSNTELCACGHAKDRHQLSVGPCFDCNNSPCLHFTPPHESPAVDSAELCARQGHRWGHADDKGTHQCLACGEIREQSPAVEAGELPPGSATKILGWITEGQRAARNLPEPASEPLPPTGGDGLPSHTVPACPSNPSEPSPVPPDGALVDPLDQRNYVEPTGGPDRGFIPASTSDPAGDAAAMTQERDWVGDFQHENGRYASQCDQCGQLFMGHKRRVTCRACAGKAIIYASTQPTPTPEPALGGEKDGDESHWQSILYKILEQVWEMPANQRKHLSDNMAAMVGSCHRKLLTAATSDAERRLSEVSKRRDEYSEAHVRVVAALAECQQERDQAHAALAEAERRVKEVESSLIGSINANKTNGETLRRVVSERDAARAESARLTKELQEAEALSEVRRSALRLVPTVCGTNRTEQERQFAEMITNALALTPSLALRQIKLELAEKAYKAGYEEGYGNASNSFGEWRMSPAWQASETRRQLEGGQA